MYGVEQVYLGVDKVYSCPHLKILTTIIFSV